MFVIDTREVRLKTFKTRVLLRKRGNSIINEYIAKIRNLARFERRLTIREMADNLIKDFFAV